MVRSLLIDVDTQVDFMDSDGKLYVPGAGEIKPALMDTMVASMRSGSPIISTMDWHDSYDPEFKTFPAHCVRGSIGSEKVIMTRVYRYDCMLNNGVNPAVPQEFLDHCMQFHVTKKTYNVWDPHLGNPNAMEAILNHFAPAQIFLCGVATEICVLAAAKGLHQFFKGSNRKFDVPKLWLIKDAIKGLTQQAEIDAQGAMLDCGFVRISSKDLRGFM